MDAHESAGCPSCAELLDRQAIADVLVRYSRSVDRRQWRDVRSCFASDATIDGTRSQGPIDDYLDAMQVTLAPFRATTHMITNQHITITGDEAVAESVCLAFHWRRTDPVHGASDDLSMQVVFNDDFVRVDGRWLIRYRSVTADWTTQFIPPRG